ncbi:MAG: cytochrome c biogenesis protein [Coriobacteriia bacterium]|nr:cytochrome c biogenesis protein [Coriobacteriia bacterium]
MSKQLKIAIILMVIGALLTTLAFFMAFYTARVQGFGTVVSDQPLDTAFALAPPSMQPTDGIAYERPWLSQKIFYFHVPVAEASFLIFTIAAIFALLFLLRKDKKYDTRSRIAMETAFVFVVATMITGVLWTRASWGVWWDWEPRLTTYFIMMILMIAYFVVRNSVGDEERAATYGAVFCLIAWVDAPLSFIITRLIPSNHPVVFQSGMDTTNLIPFIIAQIGMLMIGYAIYVLRVTEESMHERIELLKERLEA